MKRIEKGTPTTRRRYWLSMFVASLTLYFLVTPAGFVCALLPTTESALLGNTESALVAHARQRIAERLGEPTATPALKFYTGSDAPWSWLFNQYGSTHFLPHKTCVVIGPKGHNVDVVAHELTHAELVQRVGFWHRLRFIPTWFDEGLGMQVDDRPEYRLALEAAQNISLKKEELGSGRDFFDTTGSALTWRYTVAKHWVAQWRERNHTDDIWQQLDAASRSAKLAEHVYYDGKK